MTALADLQARVRRLEQRAKLRPRGSAVFPVPTDVASIRTVLRMFIEAGGLLGDTPDMDDMDESTLKALVSAPNADLKVPRVRMVLRWMLNKYEQEDDSNATAGTSDPAGPIFDAAQRLGA